MAHFTPVLLSFAFLATTTPAVASIAPADTEVAQTRALDEQTRAPDEGAPSAEFLDSEISEITDTIEMPELPNLPELTIEELSVGENSRVNRSPAVIGRPVFDDDASDE